MEKIHESVHVNFCALSSPFSASFCPHYIIMVISLLEHKFPSLGPSSSLSQVPTAETDTPEEFCARTTCVASVPMDPSANLSSESYSGIPLIWGPGEVACISCLSSFQGSIYTVEPL